MSQISISVRDFIDTYQNIIGYSADSQCAIDIINKARIIAYSTGDYVGTTTQIGLILCDGCVVIPSNIDSIRNVYACDSSYMVSYNGIPVYKHDYCSCIKDKVVTKQIDRVAVPFLMGNPSVISIKSINKGDAGKEVVVDYIDSAGTYRKESINLLFQEPVRLQYTVKKVVAIKKPITNGDLIISQCDNNYKISSRETNPSYAVYKVEGNVCGCKCVVAKAKKRYIKYTLDNLDDMLDINPEGLTTLISAVKTRDKGDANWISLYSAEVSLATEFFRREKDLEEASDYAFHPTIGHTITDELTCPSEYIYSE